MKPVVIFGVFVADTAYRADRQLRMGETILGNSFKLGPVVETTGAGDAFNGGLAAALSRGVEPLQAARFACAVAGISVTRPGTAPSMTTLQEVEALLAKS